MMVMPRGGKRAGAGRKPRPLAEKIAAGNPGHRPLKKLDWGEQDGKAGSGGRTRLKPPDYLKLIEKPPGRVPAGLPTPAELFESIAKQLEPSGCLEIIGADLLAEYAAAKYYLLDAQYALSQTSTVGYNEKKELTVSSFTEAMLKLQRNLVLVWERIWDIVTKNSETFVKNPEQDLYLAMLGGRTRSVRKVKKQEESDNAYNDGDENTGGKAESGEV